MSWCEKIEVELTIDAVKDQLNDVKSLKDFMGYLIDKYGQSVQSNEIVDLRECSQSYQQSFKDAWKAIEHGNSQKLKRSIQNLEKYADPYPGRERYLDVCCIQSELSLYRRKRTQYYMTLLAHAAVNGRKSMVEELQRCGAHTHMVNGLSGSPLTQIMVHALHHNCPEVVDGEIVQRLIDTDLNISVIYFLSITNSGRSYNWCTPIELAISLRRLDVAKQLVMAGANLIHPALGPVTGVIQLLREYFEFGTSHYLSWLLHEHLPSHKIPQFIEDVMKVDIFNDGAKRMFDRVGRHAAHAFLTCGHEEIAKQLLRHHGDHLLTIKDTSERTALQIAAQMGSNESVNVLLKLYNHKYRQDVALALLMSARRHDVRNVRSFLLHDLTVVKEKLSVASYSGLPSSFPATEEEILLETAPAASTSESASTTILSQALEEGLSIVFEVLRDLSEDLYANMLTKSCNENGDTLVHIAAITGNTKIFKVCFPLHNQTGFRMFEALSKPNYNDKTPLDLAIERNRMCILRTLQERIVERDSHPCEMQTIEKNEWEVFLKEWGPKLIIRACSCGSVDAVKLLVDMKCPLNYDSYKPGKTPLSAAAENGKVDTLQYLLNDCKLSLTVPKSKQSSPLLLATRNGHATCVSFLLNSVDVNEKSNLDDRGYNCLMIATERKHSDTVMAILSHEKGLESLRLKKESSIKKLSWKEILTSWTNMKENLKSWIDQSSKGKSLTPMRMLIEYLPDAAEWVLDKCNDSELPTADNVDEPDHGNGSSRLQSANKFEFLEDFKPYKPTTWFVDSLEMVDMGCNNKKSDDWKLDLYDASNHPIKVMVEHNRENLLNHALVKELIKYKWWKVGIPFLVLSYGLHILFLILLTAFSLLLPRPGVSCANTTNSTRMNVRMNPTNFSNDLNESAADNIKSCKVAGISEALAVFLYVCAVSLILFCIGYILLELSELYRHGPKRYFLDPEYALQNYFQVATTVCVLIFVIPVGHDCWCYPSVRWQCGALAVFLAWVNNFVLLLHIPYVGKPIAMLFNVYVNFLKLIYLPFLLIFTFGFPFYLLFVATPEGGMMPLSYPTPVHAMFDIILQTASGPGPDDQYFNFEATLSHRLMTYILFIAFIVAMPILFNNFLIGVAVGDTDEERRKAKLSLIKSKVEYIFDGEHRFSFFQRYSRVPV